MATVTVTKLEAQTVFIDGYPIDISTGETHTFPAEVTSYPVEKGADTADHVRAKPLKVSLDCIVSDTPIGLITTHSTRTDGSIPSGTMYQRLLALRDKGDPVVISTSLDVFEDMVLSDLSIPRDAGEPHQLHFKVEFTQFIFVTNNRTTVRVATPGGTGHKNLGERLANLDAGFYIVYTLKNGDPRLAALLDSPLFNPPVLHDGNNYRFRANFPSTPAPDGYVAIDDKGNRTYYPYAAKYTPGSGWQVGGPFGTGHVNPAQGEFGSHDVGQVNKYSALKVNPEDLTFK